MNIDEIKRTWSEDSKVNIDDLANEAARICELHSKYYNYFVDAKKQLKTLESERKLLRRLKREYYLGQLSAEQVKDLEWEPFDLKILKQDIDTYMESDTHLVAMYLQISEQEILCDFIESIIRIINSRGFHIKSSIDFIKFMNGM
jgi:hypothetical protein